MFLRLRPASAFRLFQFTQHRVYSQPCSRKEVEAEYYAAIHRGDLQKAQQLLNLYSSTPSVSPLKYANFAILIDQLVRAGKVDEAEHIFQQLKDLKLQPSKRTFIHLIQGHCKVTKQPYKALKLLEEMKQFGHQPDNKTYSIILSNFSRLRVPITTIENIFNQMISAGIVPDAFTFNSIIAVHARRANLDRVTELVALMKSYNVPPGIETHNCVLTTLGKRNLLDDAISLKDSLVQQNIANFSTFSTLIAIASKFKKFDLAKSLLHEMVSLGIEPTLQIYNELMHGLFFNGEFDSGMDTFAQLKASSSNPDAITYTILIGAFTRIGKIDEAWECVETMKKNSVSPNSRTYHHLVMYYVGLEDFDRVNELLDVMDKDHVPVYGMTYFGIVSRMMLKKRTDLMSPMIARLERDCYTNELYSTWMKAIIRFYENCSMFAEADSLSARINSSE